ncbi:hypothetical protein SAMN05428969_2298 [Devosia sp. YR412]|uniref:hypothetical protein n=1 Tax=Devosia sp. YR412 TaxID=1881030 RepID=UPI0008C21E03|nr:hypothetical protein [Devosia sp. YR412]SEQ22772.1 hypothetical protein SAMN05428969_2298 [Devosia sp. YR412]
MSEPRKFGMKWYWIALVAIAIFSVFPMITGISAAFIAEANGCILNEGSSNPCIIAGVDWGDTLYTMGVLTWLMFATFPLAFVLFIIWVIVLIIHRTVWRRKLSEDSRP